MADVVQVIDPFEANLRDQLTEIDDKLENPEKGLNRQVADEQKHISDLGREYDQRRAGITRELLKSTFGDAIGEGAFAEIEGFREDLASLYEGIILAKDQKPEALSVGHLLYGWAAFKDEESIDNAIADWFTSLKDKKQAKLETFLLGSVVAKRKPERIYKTETYKAAFDEYNWAVIIGIYRDEAAQREKFIAEAEKEIRDLALASGKEFAFPSQPDKTHLQELLAQKDYLEKQRDQTQHYLERFTSLYPIWLERWSEKPGVLPEQAIEYARRDTLKAIEIEDEEKKKKEAEVTATAVTRERIIMPPVTSGNKQAVGVKPGLLPAQEQARRMMAEQAEMMKYWNLWRRDPKSILGSLGGAWMEYWGNLSGYRPEAIPTEPQPAILPAEDLPKPGQIAGPEPVFVAETSPTGAQPEPGQVQTPEEPAKQLNWLQKLTSRFISKKDLRLAGEVGGKLVGVAAKEGKNVVIAQAGKRSFSLLLKNFVKGVAAKLGISAVLGVIPTGVTQVAAAVATLKAVTDVIIPESIRNQLQDLWSKAQIAMGAGITWLLMNPGALIGGILGGAVGGFFFGPVGMAGGFIAGATLGVSLQGILGPMLGFGGTALPVGSAIAAPAGITGVTGGAGVSGFGAVSSGMVTGAATGGVFGLSTAGITTFISGGIAPVMTAVITVAVGTAFTIITAVSAFVTVAATAPQQQIATGDFFTLEKTVDKANLPSDSKATVTYKITLKADSDISVTLNDKLTRGSTSLLTKSETINLAKGEKKEFAYTYTVTAADNDSELVNTATATAKAGTETETLNATVKTKISSAKTIPPDGSCSLAPEGNACSVASLLPLDGIEGNQKKAEAASKRCYAESTNGPASCRCTLAPAGNLCSVQNLLPYFGNQTMAEKASRICYRESGGNPDRTNKGCGGEYPKSYDIGLFQIGLFSHCPGAFKTGATTSCPESVANQEILDRCEADMLDPVKNIEKAVELSRNGTNWSAWTSAKKQYCNIP